MTHDMGPDTLGAAVLAGLRDATTTDRSTS